MANFTRLLSNPLALTSSKKCFSNLSETISLVIKSGSKPISKELERSMLEKKLSSVTM